MSVKIRMSRMGKTNRPYWRIIAVDSRKKRDGQYLDRLGTYDPLRHEMVNLQVDKIEDWIKKGAICSASVQKLVKTYSKAK